MGSIRRCWAEIECIVPKVGCVPQTLLQWIKHAEIDGGARAGTSTVEQARIEDLEREVKELRRPTKS